MGNVSGQLQEHLLAFIWLVNDIDSMHSLEETFTAVKGVSEPFNSLDF